MIKSNPDIGSNITYHVTIPAKTLAMEAWTILDFVILLITDLVDFLNHCAFI